MKVLEDEPIFSRRNLESAISENEVISSPFMNTLPFVGLSRVPRIFSRVVFPEPDGPLNTTKAVFRNVQVNVLHSAYLVASMAVVRFTEFFSSNHYFIDTTGDSVDALQEE